jgi:hypothetical protein
VRLSPPKGCEQGGAAPSPPHGVRGPKALRHSGWPGHVLRQNSARSARAIRADRQSFAPLLPKSVRHSGWPGHVWRQNVGRSALAIRAVRQSLGGLPLVSVRHSGWPGQILRQNSGTSARAIRAIRQLANSCARLFELPTVISPSEAALPKIKTAVNMRAGVIRILTIRARPCWSGRYDTTPHAPVSAGLVRTRGCVQTRSR